MPILSVQNILLRFGGPPLLDGVSFDVEAGDRICLVGRNGEGKSTLLKVLTGEMGACPRGERWRRDFEEDPRRWRP